MADEDKDQKTEEASSKRLRETEEKGQFAHSRELTSMFVLLAAIMAFGMAGQHATLSIMGTWRTLLSEAYAINLTTEELYRLFKWSFKEMAVISGPILLIIMIAGIVANLIQTKGLQFSAHPLMPQFNKISPMKGFGRLFSKNSISELIKSLLKVGILGWIMYNTIRKHFDDIPGLVDLSVGQILSYIGEVSLEIMMQALLFMIALAIVDYAFQLFQYKEGNMMSKQEVKQERKETEGDPRVKQRIRSAQLQIARRRMMAAVPKADVVVTNPTHISVALQYDRTKSDAPIVVAKGADYMAAKIREIAKVHNIPMVEDKPLARTLYATVEIGEIIPASLYKAIAEILAYVYQLRGKNMV